MDYDYDVFLSYSSKYPIPDWITRFFMPYFQANLTEAMGGQDVRIFFDKKGIHTGDQWKLRLKRALAKSKVLVAIWSATYFQSRWCTYELATMLGREKFLGLRTIDNPEGLIFPIKGRDGLHYPDYANDIQQRDFRDFLRMGDGFEKTTRYIDFQDEMVLWVEEVARGIDNAPEYNPDWLKIPDIPVSVSTPLVSLPTLE